MTHSAARLLIVENEAPVCDLLQQILEAEGYATTCVHSDRAAYGALDQEGASFSALVIDINLGRGTTGFDVARHARRINPCVPVVYTTGGPAKSVETHGVDGGVLVAKPFDRDLLVMTLRDKLGLLACPRR